MKLKTILLSSLLAFPTVLAAQIELHQYDSIAHLSVDGKPMIILGGELSNSAATTVDDIPEVLQQMGSIGLNTVLVPAPWDLIEPEEGHFDFSIIDKTIDEALKNNLKVVFLWFGAWKNSMSCYAPLWFKEDSMRFPRAMTAQGKKLEIATAFSDNVLGADKKAFLKVLEHIAAVDTSHTVIMFQVENEIGMLESARDYSPLAERAWKGGKWTNEEEFQATYYARYVEQLAKEGKKILNVPFYVNAALNSRGRKPGEYPSAGPLAHLSKIWKKNAPHVDFLSPDIYDTGFKSWVSQYAMKNNPLFIPESKFCESSPARAFYSFGEHHAIGFCPFAIDLKPSKISLWNNISNAYGILNQLTPYLTAKKPYQSWGLLFDKQDKERIITDGDVILTCRHYYTLPWDSRATDGSEWPEGGATIIRLAKNEYLIAGNGVVVNFQTKYQKQLEQKVQRGEDGFALNGSNPSSSISKNISTQQSYLGIGYVDQVEIETDGTFKYLRRDNGDQDHQGRHARISTDDFKILHVKLYNY